MKTRTSCIALILALVGALGAHAQNKPQPPAKKFHARLGSQTAATAPCTSGCTTLTIGWNASMQSLQACSSSLTSTCFEGYALTITPPGAAAVTIPACAPGATTGCIGPTANSYVYAPGSALAYGNYALSIVPAALGSSGPVASPAPDTGSISYPLSSLNPVTGLSGTVTQ
jgi:hypothetical protein